ncbi:hypothetical protein DV515_00004431, partial [Chloebia gouldiae]
LKFPYMEISQVASMFTVCLCEEHGQEATISFTQGRGGAGSAWGHRHKAVP